MAIVVVGGSGKDVGKTALVCAVIAALPDFGWTAVKITGHDYAPSRDPRQTSSAVTAVVCEETQAGQGTDTARYLAAGAKRALLVTRSGDRVPIAEIRAALGNDRNVIFESNRIVEELKPDLCLALTGVDEKKPSFDRLLRSAHALVTVGGETGHRAAPGLRSFDLMSTDHLPLDMARWIKEQLVRSDAA